MTIKQLDFFEEEKKDGMTTLKSVDYTSQVGLYKELKDVKGIENLSEKSLLLLHYLYTNHSKPTDNFIHAKLLVAHLGFWDTREVRACCAEIDHKTELVIYASQKGYKLASNDYEMKQAIKFSLAPAMTSIRRVFAKNKRETLSWLHGFLSNLEKEFGGIKQGQQEIILDEESEETQRSVNHFPEQTYEEEDVFSDKPKSSVEKIISYSKEVIRKKVDDKP